MYTLARGFSRQQRITTFTSLGYASDLRHHEARIYLHPTLHPYTSTTTHWRGYLPASPHRLTTTNSDPALHTPRNHPRKGNAKRRFKRLASSDSPGTRPHRYGNINPLSIDYACRPRLRSRLTLGGLTWPRNPWSFGGGVSHSPFATHACILTRVASTPGSLRSFPGHTTLPYPSTQLRNPPQGETNPHVNATASAVCLSPATLSAQDHLTSELLRTLSRMAASKPTSWLSSRPHILSHLAHASGP